MTRTRTRILVSALALTVASSVLPTIAPATPAGAAPVTFTETFTGAPASPTPWNPDTWDLTVHSRDIPTWDQLQAMQAGHGSDCAGPPAAHTTSSYEGSVFQCRDHMMTALYAEGYGVTYLTPNHLVDFSDGEAVIRFDISTLRTSLRDWWDVWISPMDTSLQLPLDASLPDLSGPPDEAVLVTLGDRNELKAQIYHDFEPVQFADYPNDYVPGNWATGYDAFLTPDAARRDTVEVRISRDHLKVGMPAYNFWWIDTTIPTLGWDTGVVQFGHHSYNPLKDCNVAGGCKPNTWHWDNVSISPAAPFTMVKADRRYANAGAPSITLDAPAPAGGRLRFAGIGDNLQVRFDGGAWQAAARQLQGEATATELYSSYWTPIPAGTTRVEFRGSATWASEWRARDISVWSGNAATTFRSGTPQRLVDSRLATAAASGLATPGVRAASSVTEVTVAGRGGVAATATSAVLNLTVTEPAGPGFLTVYPCGEPRPTTANLNYTAGQTVGNSVLAKLGTDGKVCIYTYAATHLVIDASGYFPPTATYRPLTPARVLESRPGYAPTVDGVSNALGLVQAGSVTELPITGRGGVAGGGTAGAVVLNLTATESRASGFLTVYPCGTSRPGAASLTFGTGETVANSVVAKVGANGRVCVYASAATHVVADVNGWMPVDAQYTPLAPARLLETRAGEPYPTVDGQANGLGQRAAGSVTELVVAGRGGVPANAHAVVLNLTVVQPQGGGYVTAYPCGGARPITSSANYARGDVRANLVVTKVGAGGKVCIFTYAAAHLVADVTGAFGPAV